MTTAVHSYPHARARGAWVGLAALLLFGLGCPFNPVVPNGRVVCKNADECPSGFTCETVTQASFPLKVCCKQPNCTMRLTPAEIQRIEKAVDGGARDTGAGGSGGAVTDAPQEMVAPGTDAETDTQIPPGDAAAPVCNNGMIEPPETCDPISSCPTSCPQIGCEVYELRGSAATCNATCELKETLSMCKSGDKCCPMGCTADMDSDCSCVCGNSVIEAACGEVCDPLSTCPTTCPQVACQLRKLSNMGTCQAQCINERAQTECVPSDNCCPTRCNANTDNDCMPKCGNGVIEAGEKCDGNCPTTCPTMGCQKRRLQGTMCTAECVNDTLINTCTGGDNCCPAAAGCTSVNDSDCNCACNNGIVEAACNETCDGNCPASCPPMGCQLRTLQGAANMCNVKCVNGATQTTCMNGDNCCPPSCNANNDNNCTASCGNSVVEAGEKCDPASVCQTQSNACVNDKDNVRVRSGSVAACTFQCTTTARACSGTSDTFCPTACTPCTNSCAAGQDIDCKLTNGSACTSNNQCPMGFCSDGVCCATACSGSCDVCTGGTCAMRGAGAAGVPSCSPYFCAANAAACPTSCSSDAGCVSTHYCATTCQPKKANGGTCTGANQCVSGICTDGYCCNSACTAPCDRCNVSGMQGTCATAPIRSIPSPSCPNSAYSCNGSTTACPPSSCSPMNPNCQSGYTCQNGTCQTCDPAQTPCGTDDACCSGNCFNFACL